MTRRMALLTLALVPLFLFHSAGAWPPGDGTPQGEKIAVSLRVLQERLAAGEDKEMVQTLCGMTWVSGYVLEESNGVVSDLILYGRIQPDRPALHLDDFAVALRSAKLKYARVQGKTAYYSNPGCSIDPEARVMKRLDQIAGSIDGAEPGREAAFKAWKQVCGELQTVRVLGIPRRTRFADVMVKADYEMKRIVDGSASLGIESFESLLDASLEEARNDILENGRVSVSLDSMSRFWFCPGPTQYAQDEGIVEIERCPVTLLTEEEHLSRDQAKIVGTGRANPLANYFARSFTAHYQQIARNQPVYFELEALFRFVALAKIIDSKVEFDLAFLLDRLPIPDVPVPDKLPGLSNLKRLDYRWDTESGYRTLVLWIPSCGGVEISVEVKPHNVVPDRSGALAPLQKAVLSGRPAGESLVWRY